MRKKTKKEKSTKAMTTKTVSAQSTIPYKRAYSNGIIEVEENVFTKSYPLYDLDFESASSERQDEIFVKFQDFLNSFDFQTPFQLSWISKNMSKSKFAKYVLLDTSNDQFDESRKEYNKMLKHQMQKGSNGLESIKCLTVKKVAKDIDNAISLFEKIDMNVDKNLSMILENRSTEPLTLEQRLSLLKTICNPKDNEMPLNTEDVIGGNKVKIYDYKKLHNEGKSTKDIICPNGFDFSDPSYFKMGDTYARCLFLKDYPTYLRTDFIRDITKMPYKMVTSLYFEPQNQQKMIKSLRNHLLNARSNIASAQKKAGKNQVSYDLINPDLQDDKDDTEEWLDKLTHENQKTFLLTMTVMLIADSKEELDAQTEAVINTADIHLCTIKPLLFSQEHGFCSCLPLAQCKVYADQLLTTETAALFLPYTTYEYMHKKGNYYGINQITHSMIIFDRGESDNYNGIICGTSGSGKSFAGKREMSSVFLGTKDDIIIIDPQREYTYLAQAYNGTIVNLAPGSGTHINPLDLDIRSADDENPVTLKADYICSLYELISQSKYGVNPIERSIISRCTVKLYEPYMQYLSQTGKYYDKEKCPTLGDLYEMLMNQNEPEAQNIALSLEAYAVGVFDTFQSKTNLDLKNRLIVYDIKQIGNGLKELGIQIALNDAWNRVMKNYEEGRRTWLYVDEAHILTQTESCAKLLQQIWKTGRKFNCFPTALTQDVEDPLSTREGSGMFNNCDFVLMLKQATENTIKLSQLLGISNQQRKFITNSQKGAGLIYTGKNIVPFKDEFPKSLKLYTIMSTDPKDLEGKKSVFVNPS